MHVAHDHVSIILLCHCDTFSTSGFVDTIMFLYHVANGSE